MKIVEYKLHKYCLPLNAPLNLKSMSLAEREGLIVQLIDEHGSCAFGEIAPLPGFSDESLSEALSVAGSVLKSIVCTPLPENLELCDGRFEELLGRIVPSVLFGIESALLGLKAKEIGVMICDLLTSQPRGTVSVNGLLAGKDKEILQKASGLRSNGYKAVKLKVGVRSLGEDINITKQVRSKIGDSVSLRLDANRTWSLEQARSFCEAISDCDIEYLEEPFSEDVSLVHMLQQAKLGVPIALDETLREISPEQLHTFPGVKAIVIKPTFLGLEQSVQFARQANALEITPVFSSSFESGLGLSVLANLSAALNDKDVPAGLDTISYFADDIVEGFLPVKEGQITMEHLTDPEILLSSSLLEEAVVDE